MSSFKPQAVPLTTRGDILTRDASKLVRLGLGATGLPLRSNGLDPVYSLLPSAGWEKIETKTAAASSELEFSTLSGIYKKFRLEIQRLRVTTDGASLLVQVGDGGGYKSTGYQYAGFWIDSAAAAETVASSISDSKLFVVPYGLSNTKNVVGVIEFGDMAENDWKSFFWTIAAVRTTGSAAALSRGAGQWAGGVGALTKVKIFPSASGTIASGEITLLGLRIV